jgi:hypothetical protein
VHTGGANGAQVSGTVVIVTWSPSRKTEAEYGEYSIPSQDAETVHWRVQQDCSGPAVAQLTVLHVQEPAGVKPDAFDGQEQRLEPAQQQRLRITSRTPRGWGGRRG